MKKEKVKKYRQKVKDHSEVFFALLMTNLSTEKKNH